MVVEFSEMHEELTTVAMGQLTLMFLREDWAQ